MSRAKTFLIGTCAVSAVAAGVGFGVLGTSGTANAATASYAVAPYVDLSANSSTMLQTAISQAGLKSYTAAFVLGNGCNPMWGDTLGVENSTVNAKISAAKASGASVIISFGGAAGIELGQSCTDTAKLTAAYQKVIDAYGVDHLDFDIEGASIADTASVNRRFQAIKALKAANPGLNISLTIPVMQSGPDGNGSALLKAAVSNGAAIDLVNIMTMDYGMPVADMAGAAKTAAVGTLSAAKAAGMNNYTYANIGITPMIGNNDTPGEVVSQDNAKEIVSWAKSNGIGRLSFWSIGRDQPCAGGGVSANCSGLGGSALDYTKIFLAGAGTPTTPPTTTAPSTTQPSTTSPSTTAPSTTSPTTTAPSTSNGSTTWAANQAYKVGQVVTYNGISYSCVQAHTALTGWEPPIVPALWKQI